MVPQQSPNTRTQRAANGQRFTDTELATFVAEAIAGTNLADKRVLAIIPDATRTMPMPAMFCVLTDALPQVDFLIALGTHPPMSDSAILRHFGISAASRHTTHAHVGIYNHAWQDRDALVSLGCISSETMSAISEGMIEAAPEVLANKRLLEYDALIVAGPVFPHEVAGFSGGNKYFFPGVSGAEILHLFHWLGALITNPSINGVKHTPVRRVIDAAAALIPVPKYAFCLNVVHGESRAIAFGKPEDAWEIAADWAAETHVVYKEHPYDSVLAICPERYQDIWTAGKCMYKLENVVADGGELIIYAPHITQVSVTHGALLRRIGYHTRDYFLAQMDRFVDVPGGILAHSTHVRGIGTYEDGVERPRVHVVLATSIPEAECRAINLGYRDPATIDPAGWRDKGDSGRLLIPDAGETLFRLTANNPQPTPLRVFAEM
ncbi:MAG: lactate racemase domain-containing protein [Candidatus Hydrogenedentales bacterium]